MNISLERPWHYKRFSVPRTRAIRALNNTYVINTIARKSLSYAKEELESKRRSNFNYKVPTISGDNISLAKQKSEVIKLIDGAINRDLYSQSIINGVAIAEDYLSGSLITILKKFPEKLSVNSKTVDLSLIVNSTNIDELLYKIIIKQVNSIFYDSPSKYLSYIENILSVKLSDDIKNKYIEIKATRDILVHNNGIINILYIQKSGVASRAKEEDDGKEIILDSNYFDESIRSMK